MIPLAAAVIGSAVLGAVAGEMQGRKTRQAQKDQMREQAKRDRLNMLAAAYGINSQISPAPYMQPTGGQAMQGALMGAQFAQMNKSLWEGMGDTAKGPDPSQLTSYNQSPYSNYYMGYDKNLYDATLA